MDRLSSCYFCGAAFDATLDEQAVVPSSLHPSADDQKTVVLCRTCQRKLDAVLETVLDAVDSDASGVASQSSQGSSESAPEGDDLESTLGDDEDILRQLDDDDDSDPQDPVEAAEASGMEFGDDRARKQAAEEDEEADRDEAGADRDENQQDQNKPKYTDSRGAGFRKSDEGPSETGSLTGGAFEDTDDDDDRSRQSGRGDTEGGSSGTASTSSSTSESSSGRSASDESSSGRSASDESSGGPSATDESSGGRSASDESSGGGGSASGGSGGPAGDEPSNGQETANDDESETPSRNVTMSRLENTKVMRLLENREFPVDKDEFVTVAANAYQISRADCEKVIDLAIEHDLLREENGQLYGRES